MPPAVFPHPLTLHEDSYVPGYKKLTEAVHEHGMIMGAKSSRETGRWGIFSSTSAGSAM